MIDQTLEKLIEFLENASPVVWQVLLKQVYVDAASYIAWAIGSTVTAVVLFVFGKHCLKEYKKDKFGMGDAGAVASLITAAASVIISFSLLVSAIMRFANPEFYAIQHILSQITGG